MASVALASAVAQWQAIRVGMARRKYNVKLPTVRALTGAGRGDRAVQREQQGRAEGGAPAGQGSAEPADAVLAPAPPRPASLWTLPSLLSQPID